MTWKDARIVARTDWAPDLWTARLDAELQPFSPGQFINLGLEIDGELVKRSYSLASAPGAPVEFYLVKVADGALTPRLYELGVGDVVRFDDKPQGFFTLDYVPEAEVLWLMSTGTGLGPFMSMIRSGRLWERFARVVVVHGARLGAHLGYRDELEQLSAQRPLAYVPLVTRERLEEALYGRIPAAIESGVVEKAAGATLSPDTAHVMLCGNPAMIADTMATLAKRGLRKHRTRKPGHITTEKYW
jgi:ferredoxin--NADP+ reductase